VMAIFVRDAPALSVVDRVDPHAPAPAASGHLTLELPADLALAVEQRAVADGVDAATVALAALRRGLQ
jgi:hypothetical protein